MDPREAYYHASDVVKGRWPEGEAAIARSASWSYCYARWILHARWPESELTIAQDAYYACCYAMNVLNGRFPEGEAVIMNSAYAEYYKCNFMWKEKVDWAVEGF